MALVTGDPRSATVVALSATRLLRLDKERFQALSERHPVFLRELARVLCRRIARTSEDVAFARRTYTTVFDAVLASLDGPTRRVLEVLAVADRADAGMLAATLGEAGPRLAAEVAARHPALVVRDETAAITSTASSGSTCGGGSPRSGAGGGRTPCTCALATATRPGAPGGGRAALARRATVERGGPGDPRALASGRRPRTPSSRVARSSPEERAPPGGARPGEGESPRAHRAPGRGGRAPRARLLGPPARQRGPRPARPKPGRPVRPAGAAGGTAATAARPTGGVKPGARGAAPRSRPAGRPGDMPGSRSRSPSRPSCSGSRPRASTRARRGSWPCSRAAPSSGRGAAFPTTSSRSAWASRGCCCAWPRRRPSSRASPRARGS